MTKKRKSEYLFENDILQYESLTNEVNDKDLKELDSVAKKAKLKKCKLLFLDGFERNK